MYALSKSRETKSAFFSEVKGPFFLILLFSSFEFFFLLSIAKSSTFLIVLERCIQLVLAETALAAHTRLPNPVKPEPADAMCAPRPVGIVKALVMPQYRSTITVAAIAIQ